MSVVLYSSTTANIYLLNDAKYRESHSLTPPFFHLQAIMSFLANHEAVIC